MGCTVPRTLTPVHHPELLIDARLLLRSKPKHQESLHIQQHPRRRPPPMLPLILPKMPVQLPEPPNILPIIHVQDLADPLLQRMACGATRHGHGRGHAEAANGETHVLVQARGCVIAGEFERIRNVRGAAADIRELVGAVEEDGEALLRLRLVQLVLAECGWGEGGVFHGVGGMGGVEDFGDLATRFYG